MTTESKRNGFEKFGISWQNVKKKNFFFAVRWKKKFRQNYLYFALVLCFASSTRQTWRIILNTNKSLLCRGQQGIPLRLRLSQNVPWSEDSWFQWHIFRLTTHSVNEVELQQREIFPWFSFTDVPRSTSALLSNITMKKKDVILSWKQKQTLRTLLQVLGWKFTEI